MVKWNTKRKRKGEQGLGLLDLGPVLLRTLKLMSNFFTLSSFFWNDGSWYSFGLFG